MQNHSCSVLIILPVVHLWFMLYFNYCNRRWSCWQKLTSRAASLTTMWPSWALCSLARQQAWSASRLAWQDSSIVSRNRRYSAARKFPVRYHVFHTLLCYPNISRMWFWSLTAHPPVIFSFVMSPLFPYYLSFLRFDSHEICIWSLIRLLKASPLVFTIPLISSVLPCSNALCSWKKDLSMHRLRCWS